QLGGDAREIVDEIERVLDLVRDAGRELAKQGKFLGLHEAILGGAQIFKRFGQFARAGLNLVKQANVLDSDHRLVGECCHQLDLLVGERPRLPAEQSKDTDNCSIPQQRNTKATPYIDDPGVIPMPSRVEVGIGQKIRNMYCAAFEYCAPEERSSIRFR